MGRESWITQVGPAKSQRSLQEKEEGRRVRVRKEDVMKEAEGQIREIRRCCALNMEEHESSGFFGGGVERRGALIRL